MESTSEDKLTRLIDMEVVNKNGEANGRFDDCPIMKRAIVLFKVAGVDFFLYNTLQKT